MRFVIVRLGELHRVRGHHGQAQARGQLDSGRHMGIVIRAACALQLNVKTVREDASQLQSHFTSTRGVALHQGLPHRAGLCTRQSNEALRQLLQPFEFDDGHGLVHVLRPATADELTQVQVALMVLHQQHHARGLRCVLGETF